MQRITRFARFWDLVGNSGRFRQTLPLLLANSAFQEFCNFSDWIYAKTHKTHEFAFERLCEFLHDYLVGPRRLTPETVRQAVVTDYEASGARGRLAFMASGVRPRDAQSATARAKMRQTRHV